MGPSRALYTMYRKMENLLLTRASRSSLGTHVEFPAHPSSETLVRSPRLMKLGVVWLVQSTLVATETAPDAARVGKSSPATVAIQGEDGPQRNVEAKEVPPDLPGESETTRDSTLTHEPPLARAS